MGDACYFYLEQAAAWGIGGERHHRDAAATPTSPRLEILQGDLSSQIHGICRLEHKQRNAARKSGDADAAVAGKLGYIFGEVVCGGGFRMLRRTARTSGVRTTVTHHRQPVRIEVPTSALSRSCLASSFVLSCVRHSLCALTRYSLFASLAREEWLLIMRVRSVSALSSSDDINNRRVVISMSTPRVPTHIYCAETWSVEDAQLHKAYSTLSHSGHPQVYPVAERMAAKISGRTIRSFDVRRSLTSRN